MHSPIFVPTRARVAALARRIAFRVLVADLSNKYAMDAYISLRLLESAAGLRVGAWSSNLRGGFKEAEEHFPNADPKWFVGDGGLFKAVAKGVTSALRGYSSDDHDDVIMEVIGHEEWLTQVGKSLANSKVGIDGLSTARSYVTKKAWSKASDWRNRRQEWEGAQEAEHDRTRHEQPWKELKGREMNFVELAGDRLMADKKLMNLFKRDISSMKGTTKLIMEAWARTPGKDHKDIGKALGLSKSNPSAPVGQAKFKTFQAFFARRDVLKYLEVRAEMARAENAQYSHSTNPLPTDGHLASAGVKRAKSIKRVAAAFLASRT